MNINTYFERLIKSFTWLGNLWPSKEARRFIKHNRSFFTTSDGTSTLRPQILMELNSMNSAQIAYSYLANVLAVNNSAQIIAYVPYAFDSLSSKIAFKIRKIFQTGEFGIYKSFGTTDFIVVDIQNSQKKAARILYTDIFEKLQSKWDIEAIKIHDVWVGDLVYDTYLRRFNEPTIDKTKPAFQKLLLESIELFLFWEDYINNNDVRAVSVSHCVYNLAIPLRLAIERNIPVYQASTIHVYRLSKKNLFAYNDFVYFRERFSALSDEVKSLGLAEAQRRIDRRFSGEIGVDMGYSKQSAYGSSRHPKLLHESSRKKILIATHCFFDSPHSYGNNIFPDFYEWLDFLGNITNITDYDWYIKTHPDYLSGTKEIIDSFVEKYPKFTLLPANSSHHQIIQEGVNVVLTVYGTIAFEYAALGIPVINNSLNNPHIAYDFNVHSKSVEDYRRMLLDLDNLELFIDKNQVLEYYLMRHIYNTKNMFFNDYDTTIAEIGGYAAQFTSAIYAKWLDEISRDKHEFIISALQSFVKSGDFRMDYRHCGRDISVDSIEGARS